MTTPHGVSWLELLVDYEAEQAMTFPVVTAKAQAVGGLEVAASAAETFRSFQSVVRWAVRYLIHPEDADDFAPGRAKGHRLQALGVRGSFTAIVAVVDWTRERRERAAEGILRQRCAENVDEHVRLLLSGALFVKGRSVTLKGTPRWRGASHWRDLRTWSSGRQVGGSFVALCPFMCGGHVVLPSRDHADLRKHKARCRVCKAWARGPALVCPGCKRSLRECLCGALAAGQRRLGDFGH